MVLVGYPPSKISILTTYNGQKDLLLDILAQRCGDGTPLAGATPGAVSTVDQYQGQQTILLSYAIFDVLWWPYLVLVWDYMYSVVRVCFAIVMN